MLCMYRIVKRRVMYRNQTRPDMNEGCPEKLDWAKELLHHFAEC